METTFSSQEEFDAAFKQPYEFKHDLRTEKPIIYSLINSLDNKRRLKAFITKEEYENKIPKINQKYYKEVN